MAELADIETSLAALIHRAPVIGTQSGHRMADGAGDRLRRTEDGTRGSTGDHLLHRLRNDTGDGHALLDESGVLARAAACDQRPPLGGSASPLARFWKALVAGVRWDAGRWCSSIVSSK
jgi:hypothetical protein